MNLRYLLLACLLSAALPAAYAQKARQADLTRITRTFNRTITIPPGSKQVFIHPQPEAGGAWLQLPDARNAEVTLEIKGRDVMQQSFVGIAFHGQNDSTYEAVYFRPFNFNSPDSVRKRHAVQYISLPQYDWPILREQFPGKYESAINAPTNPNDWFKARIRFRDGQITVYIGDAATPCLQVQQLGNLQTGKIALWTGHISPGEFRNMTITYL